MQNKIKMFLVMLFINFLLANISFAADNNSVANSWSIDKFMRFQIAYLPDVAAQYKGSESTASAKAILQPVYLPDITNINLAKFLDLGFDVPRPTNPEQYNLYLKLYQFPENLSQDKIVAKFFADFELDQIQNAKILRDYLSDKQNIILKLAYIEKSQNKFTKENPIPTLQTGKNPDFAKYFIEHIPFYSLYLMPASTEHKVQSLDQNAKNSAAGVKNFYKKLLVAYRNNLKEISGTDNKYYYFMQKNRGVDSQSVKILKVPKQILIFANWRDLPMPQDPKNIFLSSLLLVYKTEYVIKPGVNLPVALPKVDSNDFNALFIDSKTQVLEVGSVVYRN